MIFELDKLNFQNKPWVKNLTLFLFCFAIIFGPAYALFDSFNYDTPDIRTYLGLAGFDFDQSPIRKYRVIVPFLAAGINYLFGPLFESISPNSFPGPDFSMCFSFLIVNCSLMSVFGVLIYRLCRESGVSSMAAIVGLLSALTCRWTSYIAGLPLIDSLYMVVAAMTILGIKTKSTKLIILAIFLGPWARESFIFFVPLIFFFSPVRKRNQVLLFSISGLLVFAFRYFLDSYNIETFGLGIEKDFAHVFNVPAALRQLFSFHGIYEIISISGIWGLLFIFLTKKSIRTLLKQKTELYMVLFLLIVLIHVILSSDIARMFYISLPVIAVWLSLITDEIITAKL